uniref:Uncharacterized protein n=1 Tax=Ditylenchus dipsaci TaxID=166011 RepID=A0A915CVJ6_9BILA
MFAVLNISMADKEVSKYEARHIDSFVPARHRKKEKDQRRALLKGLSSIPKRPISRSRMLKFSEKMKKLLLPNAEEKRRKES